MLNFTSQILQFEHINEFHNMAKETSTLLREVRIAQLRY